VSDGPLILFPLDRTASFENRKNKMNGLGKVSLLTMVLSLLTGFCWAEEFSGRVVAVKDGDTIEVLHSFKAERIRLADIDCPEMGQPFGNRAKQLMGNLVFGKDVLIRSTGKDRYGRTIGEIFVDGMSVGEELVKNGAAWWYQKYSSNSKLSELEREARHRKCGLWVEKNPMPPWDWRTQKKNRSKSKVDDAQRPKREDVIYGQ
jgi:endonuclease YncB( thermonuclease family)